MKEIRVAELVKAVDGELIYGEENGIISSVSTNSKEIEEGALFVPIIGERVDAHQFIDMAFGGGATATFTSRKIENFVEGKAYIKVEDTVKALQKAAAWYRSQFDVKLIGITGSVGKTTTKEMIAAALEESFVVLKTKGNMNSQIGLPLMMFELETDTQIAVIEMGMSEVGEMSRLAAIAKPDLVVMTNIGVSHIGQLGSKDNIRKEKMNIIDQCVPGTKVFVNGEDPLLQQLCQFSAEAAKGKAPSRELFDEATIEKIGQIQVECFGTGENCEYRGIDNKTVGEKQKYTYVSRNCREEIQLAVLGAHNVNNATVAMAIAEYFGVEPAKAKEGLAAYRPIAMRGQIYEHAGRKIIDDTYNFSACMLINLSSHAGRKIIGIVYNASPDSMKSGASVLLEMEGVSRRIAVFADVLELGEVSRSCHYEVGQFLADKVVNGHKLDAVLTVGKEAKAICEAIKDSKSDMFVKAFASNEEIIAYLKEYSCAGDGILVKGSRGMHMEKVVKALQEMD